MEIKDLVQQAAAETEAPGSTFEGDDPEVVINAREEELESFAGDSQEDSSDEEPILADGDSESSEDENLEDADTEVITITDDSGKRKLKIDYSDRDKIKKYAKMAAGMRKFQAERDQTSRQLDSIKAEHQELQGTWSKLEDAFSNAGVDGVVKLLTGGNQSIDQLVEQRIQEREFLSQASPEEVRAFEAEKSQQEKVAESEKLRTEFEALKAEVQAKEDSSAVKELQSIVNPAFDKYRFEGKLSDDAMEHRLDSMLWSKAKSELGELQASGVQLTPAIIDRAFKKEYAVLKKFVSKEAEKTVKSTIKQKKREAQENVQIAATKGLTGKTALKQKADESLKSGNYTDLIANWSQYQKLF